MVLRDSLGGNCKTKMIATVSAEADDIYESLSTCRFAKRVSKIQNLVSRNEQVDPGIIIQRLKREVAELKAELAMLKGGEGVKESLNSEDIDRCNKAVEDFVYSQDPTKAMQVMADRLMINQCFYHFKHLFKDMNKKKGAGGAGKDPKYTGPNFGNAAIEASPAKGGDKVSAAENEELSSEV
jgi:kinesin family protein 6/9